MYIGECISFFRFNQEMTPAKSTQRINLTHKSFCSSDIYNYKHTQVESAKT